MASKRSRKFSKQNKTWQEKVEKKALTEKIELDHPQGKERFEKAIKRLRHIK